MKLSEKLQKLFAMLLVAVMVVSVLPIGSLSVFATVGEFAGGDGSEENPYLIATKTQLNNVRNYLDANFKMIADIEFDDSDFEEDGEFYNDGAGFEPIGLKNYPFTGTFDGDEHVIKNLYVNIKSYSTIYAGLFGYIKAAQIGNLGIVDGNITVTHYYDDDSYAYAGGIVGFNSSGTITNCYNIGNVSAHAAGDYTSTYAGGIAGFNGRTITNCYNTGEVSATANGDVSLAYAGGIVGAGGIIENCYNTGNISSASEYVDHTGGIAGENTGTITNCYNTGEVSASSSFADGGGIAGDNSPDGTITNCYNIGTVSADSSSFAYAGGIAGDNYGTITNCYYINNISKGVADGPDTATKCTDEELKKQETYIGFDFETVWTMESNTTYPYPILMAKLEPDEDDLTVEFAGGDGSEENPYLIATKAQLNSVRNFLDANFRLIADIEFTDADFELGGDFYNYDEGFEPIGTDDSVPFTGTFDGDGYVIKNLYINIVSTTDVYAGLFGYSKAAQIENLGIVDGKITATTYDDDSYAYAGGIVGYNASGTIENCYNTCDISAASEYVAHAGGIAGYSYGTITNCYNTGNVSANASDDSYSGGIVGYNNNGTITNCYNIGSVSLSYYAGGVVGYNNNGTITNCYNTGNISAVSPSDYYSAFAGGIVGRNGGTITNCYNTGDVSASAGHMSDCYSSACAGGIVGSNGGTIENCYNTGEVSADSVNSAYAGGIVGDNGRAITNCYNTGNVSVLSYSGSSKEGGIAGYNGGTIENCYNTGDVSDNSSSYSDSDSYAGGIAGYNGGTITNCYNIGEVSAVSSNSDSYAGGIVGYNREATITNCYNTGNVSASGSYYVYAGGIAGYNYNYGTINNCYYADNIAIGVAHGRDTATKCTFYNLKNQETFVGFDFETVWTINSDSDYPYPILQSMPKFEISGITSDIYAIEDGYVFGVGSKTTVIDFLNNLNEGSFCKIYNGEDELGNDDLVGTGMVVKRFEGETETAAYTLVITGDINGDGKIDSVDYLLIKRSAFGTYTLTEAMTLAG
ncbi:MAG: hypothetical protein J6Q89_07530, partial [Clostridia bacterium]|nr:hypothetical protein [Clostridia bacterium]